MCFCFVLIGAPCLIHRSVVLLPRAHHGGGKKQNCVTSLCRPSLPPVPGQGPQILPRLTSLCSCPSECHTSTSARSDIQTCTCAHKRTGGMDLLGPPRHQQRPAGLFQVWIKNWQLSQPFVISTTHHVGPRVTLNTVLILDPELAARAGLNEWHNKWNIRKNGGSWEMGLQIKPFCHFWLRTPAGGGIEVRHENTIAVSESAVFVCG